jgi:signal transduction histidine kinase
MTVDDWVTVVSQIAVTLAAVLILIRIPRHLVGWLLAAFAVLSLAQNLAAYLAVQGLRAHPGPVPCAPCLASFSEAAQRPLIGLALALLLVFPDGKLPSGRWRPVALSISVVFPLWFVVHLLAPGRLIESPFTGLPNALGIAFFGTAALKALYFAFLPAAGLLGAAVAVSVLWRFCRSLGDERQQLKIVGLAFFGVVVGLAALGVTGALAPAAMEAAGDVLALFLWTVLPLAVVVAMSRYRLYDIDLLINRTLVYGLLSLLTLATYTAVVLAAGRLASSPWTSPWTVALATLAAASVISPGRRRIQREVDRLFSRREYDAVRLVEDFARQWRDAPQPPAAVTGILAQALGDPSLTVAYWLRERAAYTDARGTPVTVPGRDGADRGRPVTLVARASEPIAALIHDPVLQRCPALLSAVTRASLLVLENARLQAEVCVQLAEVRRSRARIIEAADAERQRIERDLHDGAQQRLVALALRLTLAQRNPAASAGLPAGELVAFTVEELNATVNDLRELARGIAPVSLVEEGLGAALDGIAARTPTPVIVDVPDRRFPAPVERAVYYMACEAVTNAVKHAAATAITVRVQAGQDTVRLAVTDDGCGGAHLNGGSGLRGLTDRVEALGGTLVLTSPPDAGTVLDAEVPCES